MMSEVSKREEGHIRKRLRVRGELTLCVVAVLNSFALYLMIYCRGGITPISAVPYILSEIFPALSLGGWTYLFQTVLIAILVTLRLRRREGKKAVMYLFSFLIGGVFSIMVDVHALWIDRLPYNLPLALIYFVISFFSLAFGIALSNHCKMPIIPTDLFPRELSILAEKPYKVVKTAFDVLCLVATILLGLLFLGRILGIGVITVICAFTLGKTISVIGTWLTERVEFISFLEPGPENAPPEPEEIEA